MNYYALALKKYAQFSGRATRSEYWYFVLFNALASIALSFIEALANLPENSISGLYSLALLIPSLALTWRRLHDIGKSGANVLWALLPVIGWIYLIVLYCKPSQEGDNQYGPNPHAQ